MYLMYTIKNTGGVYVSRNHFLTWNDVPALIDLEQASLLLGLSIESVRRYCVMGDIPAIQIGKQWRIDKEKLMKKFGHF
jgi:excisionase family DNA binding protein